MMEEDSLERASKKMNNLIIKQTHNFHVAGNDWRLFFSRNKGRKKKKNYLMLKQYLKSLVENKNIFEHSSLYWTLLIIKKLG